MFRRTARIAAAIMLALTTASCGSRVISNVTSFSQLGSAYTGKTIAVVPIDDAQKNSLEFQRYVAQLKAHLSAKGFRPIDDDSSIAPDYVAFFDFGIDNGHQVSSNYSMPVWGQTGVSSSYSSGTLSMYGNSGTYSGTTTYTPTYGVTGYTTGTTTSTVYSRVVNLDIMRLGEGGKSEKAYEARLSSSGNCGNLTVIMGSLLEAMFKDFPKDAGGTVEVPWNGEC